MNKNNNEICDATKAAFKGKFTALNASVRKEGS